MSGRISAFLLLLGAMLLPLLTSPVGAQDLVILRAGTVETGSLRTCASDRCQLGNKTIPRAAIAWIGLGTRVVSPPAVRDPTADEVQLKDGSVRSGRLASVSAKNVVTASGSFPRERVAWIFLATPPETQPPKAKKPEVRTGDTWVGTLRATSTLDRIADVCRNEVVEMEFRVVVGGDGIVTGTSRSRLVSLPDCPLPPTVPMIGHISEGTVKGWFTTQRFELDFILPSDPAVIFTTVMFCPPRQVVVVPVIGPDAAEGQPSISNPAPCGHVGGGSTTITVKMKCTHCKKK